MKQHISRIALLIAVFFIQGCAFIQLIDIVKLSGDYLIYEQIKECRSKELTLEIWVKRPVENPDEDIWTKDIFMKVTIHRKNPVTLIIYDELKKSDSTKGNPSRTFTERPDFEKIMSSPSTTVQEFFTIFKSIAAAYYGLIDECLYGFK